MINIYGKISLIFILCILACRCFSQPCVWLGTSNCKAITSTSEFLMSTSANVDFEFNNMQKYITGITHGGSTQLRLKVDENIAGNCKWKLIMYVDNNWNASKWETITSYGPSVNVPELDLIAVNVYNGCGTPILSGTYQVFDGNVQHDIIDIIDDPVRTIAGSCTSQVNGPGDYLTNYNEFSFYIDYRIIPGFIFSPGVYQIKIWFCLVEVP